MRGEADIQLAAADPAANATRAQLMPRVPMSPDGCVIASATWVREGLLYTKARRRR